MYSFNERTKIIMQEKLTLFHDSHLAPVSNDDEENEDKENGGEDFKR